MTDFSITNRPFPSLLPKEKAPMLEKITQDSQDFENENKAERPLTRAEKINEALWQRPSSTLGLDILFLSSLLIPTFLSLKEFLGKANTAKKDTNQATRKVAIDQLKKTYKKKFFRDTPKNMAIGLGVGLLGYLGINALTQAYYKPKAEAHIRKRMTQFNEEKGVASQAYVLPVPHPLLDAEADPVSGNILLNPVLVKDLLFSKWRLDPIMSHELKHLEQFILMGISPNNGFQRLNFITVKKMVDELKKAPEAIIEIREAHNEILRGLSDEDKQKNMSINGFKMPTTTFVEACYTLMYKQDAKPEDIPMVINQDFYQKAAKVHGKLSPEEIEKAEAYFQAWENYSEVKSMSNLPESSYHKNILEKEAFETMPWYTR